jgi:hypothetical protein
MAFTTRNQSMVASYRRGERMQWEKAKGSKGGKTRAGQPDELAEDPSHADEAPDAHDADLSDRLADAWTEDETFLAQVNQERRADDISPSEFELYQSCLEETLETPDEVWSLEMTDPEGIRLYHFIREYPNERPGYWYVIVARETDNEEQIEILDAFPTRDSSLVDRYRRGTQEVGETDDARAVSRMVH